MYYTRYNYVGVLMTRRDISSLAVKGLSYANTYSQVQEIGNKTDCTTSNNEKIKTEHINKIDATQRKIIQRITKTCQREQLSSNKHSQQTNRADV